MSDPVDNDSLLYLDTIPACDIQHVYVQEFVCVVIIESQEHHIRRNGGELSWKFLDELSSVAATCNIGILTFLEYDRCSLSDASTYDLWKTSTGKCSARGGERHDILLFPLDMRLTDIDFGGDIILFEV